MVDDRQKGREAVHEFRRHHEGVNRSLKLLSAAALHFQDTCTEDSRSLISSLISRSSSNWGEANLSVGAVPDALRFAATSGLVAVLSAFEDLGDKLEQANLIVVPSKEEADGTKAGRVAFAISQAAGHGAAESVLINYFGRVRNRIAHPGTSLTPGPAERLAHKKLSSTKTRPSLPVMPGGMACDQTLLASSLCLCIAVRLVE